MKVSKKKVAKLLGIDERDIYNISFWTGGCVTPATFDVCIKGKKYEVPASHLFPEKLKDINAKRLVKLFRKHCPEFAKDFPKLKKNDKKPFFSQDVIIETYNKYGSPYYYFGFYKFCPKRKRKVALYFGLYCDFKTITSFETGFNHWSKNTIEHSNNITEHDFAEYKNFLLSLIPDEFK